MGRRGTLAGGAAVVAVAVAVAGMMMVSGGDEPGDSGDSGDGVVLEPAASVSPGAFLDDLDLYPVEERALADPSGAEGFDAFVDLDEPVALAGLMVRAFEPGLYTGTQDRPPCDVEALASLVGEEAEADAATVGAWYAALGEDVAVEERDNFLADLTPARLRFDTRVTSHRLEAGQPADVQALLQAGTAVLLDEGRPRVRCAGGHPLAGPERAPDLDGAAAHDLGALAENPDDAWDGLDPARVVVVDGIAPQDELDLADAADGTLFRRHEGSDGTRDQTLGDDEEDRPDPCADGCLELVITMAADVGSEAVVWRATGGGHLVTTPGVQPTEVTRTEVVWTAFAPAIPGAYGVAVIHAYEPLRRLTEAEMEAITVPGYLESLDNPEVEGESIRLGTQLFDGLYWPSLDQCVPGDITVTFTLAGEVADTVTQHVGCDEPVTFEFVVG